MVEIAIPDGEAIRSVSVRWPAGTTQAYRDVVVGKRYLLIEQKERAFAR
jgi:hypothetical protein